MSADAFAPAKVNLYLHVGPLRPDGFHPIGSLFVFADVGDRLSAEPADRFSLTINGTFADDAPPGEDNLVVRALRALCGGADPPLRMTLFKALPAAAGLGGGSSDAAAALQLARRVLGLDVDDQALHAIAAKLGSDVPACLEGRPVLAQGRGELLSPGPSMPAIAAVLARPGAGSATGPVYREFDKSLADEQIAVETPGAFDTSEALIGFLASTRNDLEAPAVALEPQIGAVLAALRGASEALMARMSGSGSACFALCPDQAAAERLAERLSSQHPDWWVTPCRLGGPWG